MNITVVGTGYVGLVSGACFAEMGTNVTCIDIDSHKIDNLKNGIIPIYEPGLSEIVKRNYEVSRLNFSTDLSTSIEGIDIVFCAVGTPPDEDGSADLQYVLNVARTVGRNMSDYVLFVTKSTVPVGTAAKVKSVIEEELKKRGVSIEFDVASNPEFLKEGSAVKDFLTPDRIVVGVDNDRSKALMARLYNSFVMQNQKLLFMDILSAEMTKYAANAMLATRISFMNDIANLCERVGADVNNVRLGIGSDERIGTRFLYPGCGYGGSCFPKDVKALVSTGKEHGCQMRVIEAVEQVNETQKVLVFDKLLSAFGGEVKGKRVALWGLSFKPETDDMREAPSLVIIERLIQAGAEVYVFDPVAMGEAQKHIGNSVIYCKDMYEALVDADALALITEWKQFRIPSWSVMAKTMRGKVLVDGRNIYNRSEVEKEGFTYLGIGR